MAIPTPSCTVQAGAGEVAVGPVRTTLGSSLLSATISAILWIIISFATGGTAVFALVGGLVLLIVVFVIGYSFRRLIWNPRHPRPGQ